MEATYTQIKGLTEDQSKAVAKLRKDQEGKFFRGISIGVLAEDFRVANTLKLTNPEKAASNEKALFALCGYDPFNSP